MSAALASSSKEELVSLTSLRGLAALAVVMQHFSTTAQKLCAVPIPSLVPHGYVAVDFFFVLSGYVMCYTYLQAFQQREPGVYGAFLLKRAVRLLPLNAFVLLLMLAGAAVSTALIGRNIFYGTSDAPLELPANFLMLQGLGLGNSLNGPAWSVSAEIGAYVLFPLLVIGAFHRRRGVWMAAGLLALLALVVVALRLPRLGLASEDPVYGGLRCLSQFTIGMLSYRLSQWPRAVAVFARDGVAFGLVALAVVLLLGPRIDLLVVATFPFIIVAAALNRGRFDRLMARRPLVALGLASYALYMIHDPLRSLLQTLVKQWHPQPLGPVAALLFALGASLALVPLAVLTYHAIEKPSRTHLRRWLTARSTSS